ncbi:hypothetical protein Ae717Ps2_4253c [Pseudonocardia sp. Ae717_Ps2]|uniref:hypothetical protein n=1 Tax=Pseudonocardia sp. Ae717_Ps2 TaxID=1885573 RepID=UPI00095D7296|nr:hypothetical protein [Pseudonocardia sp. Ae717_Ps2]OLM33357.1 hypothetical protein Ae717Ps2_4253c [Pseudonocardia sp. Ae717_Ps2]
MSTHSHRNPSDVGRVDRVAVTTLALLAATATASAATAAALAHQPCAGREQR